MIVLLQTAPTSLQERRALFIRKPLILLLSAAVGTWNAPAALAWGAAGHRQVCELAWDELQTAAAREIRAALAVQTREAFAARCQHEHTAASDVMGLPAGARELDLARDCPAARSCPVREIERAFAQIEMRSGDLAEAILRLAHFTAEVHQPLSVGYAADRNGQDIPATFMGRATNMYAIWSEALVAAPRPPRPALDTGFELRLITNFLERPRWVATPPLAWATESYWIMRTPATGYVGNPGGLAFDEVFVAQNKLTVMDQLEKAGIRLAHLLNRAFGDPGGALPGASPPPSELPPSVRPPAPI